MQRNLKHNFIIQQARSAVIGLVFLITLITSGLLLKELNFDQEWIISWIGDTWKNKELLFIIAGTIATSIGLPRQALSFVCGYTFGLVNGTVLATLATVLGSSLTFFLARLLSRDFVVSIASSQIDQIDRTIGNDTFFVVLLVRLLPVGSNLTTNLIAGVSRVRVLPFVLGSSIGFLPQNFIFALAGSGIYFESDAKIIMAFTSLLLCSAMGYYLFWRRKIKNVN